MPRDFMPQRPVPARPNDAAEAGLFLANVLSATATEVVVDIDGERFDGGLCLCCPTALTPGTCVAVQFSQGAARTPVILGPILNAAANPAETRNASMPHIKDDTEALVVSHPRKVTLRCGDAVLCLDASGRIELNGEHLVSSARGLNRIAGASVKIN